MIKAFSMILIAFGLAAAGRYFASCQCRRADLLGSIIRMIAVTETQLRYMNAPVCDLLKVLSENPSLSQLGFIKCARERVCFGEAFPDAWRESIETETEMCRMLAGSVRHLVALGADLGSTDLEGQLSCCGYYREIFRKELELQEEKSKRYSKLFPPLGLLAGISAAIFIA